MRWGCEYRLMDSPLVGLLLFSAANKEEATRYVDNLLFLYSFDSVSNLKPLVNGACVDELKRLFPGFLQVKIKPAEEKDEGKTT